MRHLIHNPLASLAICLISALSILPACNTKESDTPDTTTSTSVAITEFSLNANSKVAPKLDKVFFSIDLENGVIFNADSLPMGTDISRLTAKITFAQTPDLAEIEMTGGSVRQGTIDYRKNSTDTLDFTGRVILTVGVDDVQKSYRLKVNVHRAQPDALMWSDFGKATLPSRMPNPKAQRTVAADDGNVYCTIQENDGSYTLADCRDLHKNEWSMRPAELPAGADMHSLTLAGNSFYILDAAGRLFKSPISGNDDTSAFSWTDTGCIWSAIIGPYADYVLGISSQSGTLRHTHYPASDSILDSPMADGFPVKEFSNLALISSSWSASPTALVCGGVTKDGDISDRVWAFDGTQWIILTQSPLVKFREPCLIPYYSYRQTTSDLVSTEFPAWILIGGREADNTGNRQVMISYDNGMTWRKGSDQLSLPSFLPTLYNADAIVISQQKSANISDAWTKMAMPADSRRRLAYEIDGDIIKWQCPYIYLFGGYTGSASLNATIWRGVLARLTFTPLI